MTDHDNDSFAYSVGAEILPGYFYERILGRGGFGEVYLVRNAAGARFALKVVHQGEVRELRGAESVIQITSLSIVRVFDIQKSARGELLILMEYVQGPTLRQYMKDRGTLPLDEAARITNGILKGLHVLHEHRLVHRDIKPENVFLDGEVVRVGDHGLVRIVNESTVQEMSGQVGTCRYMAPEMFDGVCDERSDLWAVGTILYEMLVGRPAFDGDSQAALIRQILDNEPNWEAVPDAARPVLERALAKSPSDRYETAEQMSAAVSSLMGEADSQSRVEPFSEKRKAPSRHAPEDSWEAVKEEIEKLKDPASKLKRLDAFLAKYPDHPRKDEIYLLRGKLFAETERDEHLRQWTEFLAAYESSSNPKVQASVIRRFIHRYPNHPRIDEAYLMLGRAEARAEADQERAAGPGAEPKQETFFEWLKRFLSGRSKPGPPRVPPPPSPPHLGPRKGQGPRSAGQRSGCCGCLVIPLIIMAIMIVARLVGSAFCVHDMFGMGGPFNIRRIMFLGAPTIPLILLAVIVVLVLLGGKGRRRRR